MSPRLRNAPCKALAQRFREKYAVNKTTGCWEWQGYLDQHGYGVMNAQGRTRYAHRVAYELLSGAVPEAHELHHTCEVPVCVNPDHLIPLTQREHWEISNSPTAVNARKTHCVHGHEFTPENTYHFKVRSGGTSRSCRTCRKDDERRYRARRALARAVEASA